MYMNELRHNECLFNVNSHPHSICVHHYSHEDQLSLTAVIFDFHSNSFHLDCVIILKEVFFLLPSWNWVNTVNSDYGWTVRWRSEWEHRVMRRLVFLHYLQWSKFVLLLQGNQKHQSWIRTSGKLCFFPPSVFPETLISASKMNVQQLLWNTREVFLWLPHDCLGFHNFYSFICPIPFFYISSIIFAFVFLLKGVAC